MVVHTYQVLSVRVDTNKNGGVTLMCQSKIKCCGHMRQFWVGLTDRGSPMTNCLSLSGCRDSAKIFWSKNQAKPEIPWFLTLVI